MGTKTFNNYEDLLTFTRASGGHALRPCTFTETAINGGFDTDTSWNKGTGWSIGSGVASIDGSQSAGSSLYQSKTVTAGDIIRMTVEVTAITSGTIAISYANGTGTLSASPYYATSSTGTIQRIFTVTGSGSVNFVVSGSTSAVASVDNVSIATVTFDQPDGTLTLFEHPDNVPRVEWDADRNRLGLLVEEARTNLIPYSEDFNSWDSKFATLQSGFSAPDGTNTASLLTVGSSGNDRIIQSVTATSTSVTLSVFAKEGPNSNGKFKILLRNGTTATNLFNTTLTITSGTSVGSGWYRHDIAHSSGIASGNSLSFYLYVDEFNTVGSDNYFWGAQLEAGSFPTSYIKNQGTSGGVTRSADVASIKLSDFGFNYNALTLFVEAQRTNSDATFPRFLHISDDNVETIEIIGDTDDDVRMYARDTGGTVVVNADIATGISIGDTFKAAFAMKQGDAAGSGNGATPATDTDGFVMGKDISDDALYLGSTRGTTQFLTGYIKQVKVYPRRLTNAQLQEITS